MLLWPHTTHNTTMMSLFAWAKLLNLFSLDSGKHPKLEGQEEKDIFQSAPGHDLWHG